ncbi:MAG: 6-phosphofructokinase [Clostridiales bacterium]|nr:6-phosphofructokinase [Clostridiales bacterium]
MKVGILTSGGDCPGLNAVIRGIGKSIFENVKNVELIGIADGYGGLIRGECRKMEKTDFTGILTLGGTILGTSRQPFKLMTVEDENSVSRLDLMKQNYKKMGLDCLLTLGGAGTHKTAALLSAEGCNVIGLPKTIDNDIWGTDVTFGFHTAVDIATECIDRLHSTAASHGRTMVVEIMGNKAGWLTLYSGLAGGADVILLPEIPFSIEKVAKAIERRAKSGKAFSIVAVAEGAMTIEESKMKKKERAEKRGADTTITNRLAKAIAEKAGVETRVVVPGHIQRGGSPSAYDRVLSTEFGSFAGKLVKDGRFGVTVAMVKGEVTYNALADIAGKAKLVPDGCQEIKTAESIGICLGR